ncbi:MAG: flavodoxin family protein [Legionellaceae bacterium]|nr:flavodoxin family protein [Legionellaceae bacterium]
MKPSAIIIFGSSRSTGGTRKAVDNVFEALGKTLPVTDLVDCELKEYDYEFRQDDDFKAIIQRALQYDVIILATPVYWYSVSAKMKIFIDRLSDLLAIHKALGRQLRGKKMAVIASYYTYPEGKDGFEQPLKNTAKYLGMDYVGTYFHYSGENPNAQKESTDSLAAFSRALLEAVKNKDAR